MTAVVSFHAHTPLLPGGNFHPMDNHVVPGLDRRFYEAKVDGHPKAVLAQTSKMRRGFLQCDDPARPCIRVMEAPCGGYAAVPEFMRSHINIAELAERLATVTRLEVNRFSSLAGQTLPCENT